MIYTNEFKRIKELKDICKLLIAKNGYIKGVGKKDRIMDREHNPIMDIDRNITSNLVHNKLIIRDHLVLRPTELIHSYNEIKYFLC